MNREKKMERKNRNALSHDNDIRLAILVPLPSQCLRIISFSRMHWPTRITRDDIRANKETETNSQDVVELQNRHMF
jgi:hypothetical protein